MIRHGLILLSALILGGTAVAPAADAATPVTTGRGGSNYNFYRIDHDPGGCDREPYNVINAYHRAPQVIQAQLAELYAAGQRRLRFAVFHRPGPESGAVMDSTGGNLSPRNRKNFADLLAVVKKLGFQEIEVGFHPIGAEADPHWWTEEQFEERYRESFSLIRNVRAIVKNAGIPYRLDLLNEGMPLIDREKPSPQEIKVAKYARRLWADYTAAYGKSDTVGFSMTVWVAGRAREIPNVYGGNAPDVFDVHLYGDDWSGDEYRQFVEAHNEMSANGYSQGWIIGESYYNDKTAAEGIARAIKDTGREVFYLTQWAQTRQKTCPEVDVAPPSDFTAYQAAGF
ncbi:hypothetical protein [Amycolatopsis anabasis]|uniref:hypothetical protein n=1 Tax=Amycolatopsis anabasis TaxID=1840409 RepID=UPI00131BD336|nr:hypothetical protein [Amycolatopsis anabasis]